jgi:SPP1 family predicted phage head-tail adaptor
MPTYVIDSIGRLRNSVVIQQFVLSAGIQSLQTFATVFASITPMSGTEGPNARLGAPNQNTFRVRIRYLKGVKPKMRLLLQPDPSDATQNRVLEIDAVQDDPDERHHFMDLSCREVTA